MSIITALVLHTHTALQQVFLVANQHLPANPLVGTISAADGSPCGQIKTVVDNIVGVITGIGAAVCALGIAVGGIMRATSFGSERRISESNTAITCAVVGLVTVLLSQTLGGWIGGMVGGSGCGMGPDHLLLVLRALGLN